MAKQTSCTEVIGNHLLKSFFDKNYQTPLWFKEKGYKEKQLKEKESVKLSRRSFLKSAAGASAIGISAGMALPALSLTLKDKNALAELIKTDPWKTLDATLMHLLPDSPSSASHDPSAKDINALAYLHQVMTVQPTEQDEKAFILKGVGWLNGFANSEYNKLFVELTVPEKELLLRSISRSQAGGNWLNTLLNYIFEAMLAPPSYGGNPNGIGWQWLDHKAGFPLPKAGQRYFELPPRGQVAEKIVVKNIANEKINIKRSNKA